VALIPGEPCLANNRYDRSHERAERGISGITLAAALTNAIAIMVNYSTSRPPDLIAENISLSWILLVVLIAAFVIVQTRALSSNSDAYDASPSTYKKYTRRASDIDTLPVSERVRIRCVEFGERPQKVTVSDLRAFELESGWLISATPDWRTSAHEALHLPHRFLVSAAKATFGKTLVYVITDLAYVQAASKANVGSTLLARCKLDRGGILPFLDIEAYHKGRVAVRSDLGARGLIVAVQFRRGEPVARSRYILGVRCGIRYPDDLWISSRTGSTVLSERHRDIARVAFQTRQEGGLGADVFACHVDGSRMVNLTRKSENAYDGFFRGDTEVVQWNDDGCSLQIASHLARKNGVRIVQDNP
jgi:hypothetical protein